MDTISSYGLIWHYGINGNRRDAVHPALWKFYKSPSTQSFITEHVLIMDDDFYKILLPHLGSIPYYRIMVVSSNRKPVSTRDRVNVFCSLMEALGHSFLLEKNKPFVVSTSLLSVETSMLRSCEADEIIRMQVDVCTSAKNSFANRSLTSNGWETKEPICFVEKGTPSFETRFITSSKKFQKLSSTNQKAFRQN